MIPGCVARQQLNRRVLKQRVAIDRVVSIDRQGIGLRRDRPFSLYRRRPGPAQVKHS